MIYFSKNMCSFFFKIICVVFLMNLVKVESLNLHLTEESPCVWNNVTGTCVDYRRCTTYTADIKENDFPPTCSYNGIYPVICCTACEIYNTTYAIAEDERIKREFGQTGVKHYDKCIQNYRTSYHPCKPWHYNVVVDKRKVLSKTGCHEMKIIGIVGPAGGVNTKRSEFPHMVLLGYGKDLESAQWLCGGSVISDRFILTAAHCQADPHEGPVKYVGLGMLKRSDPVELWDRYRVNRFIPHPGYKSPSKYHDIALIETDTEIQYGRNVLAACIAGGDNIQVYNYHVVSEDAAFATGWGALGHRRETADVLQKVDLQEFSLLECAVQYPPGRNLRAGYNHSTQMCYGDRDKPRDTCSGDSGSPLQIRSAHASCLFVVLGVTSYGGACGFAGSAGIYTRVRDYVPWIEDIVWPDDDDVGDDYDVDDDYYDVDDKDNDNDDHAETILVGLEISTIELAINDKHEKMNDMALRDRSGSKPVSGTACLKSRKSLDLIMMVFIIMVIIF